MTNRSRFATLKLTMGYSLDDKAAAVRRVQRGEQAKVVAADVGCSRTTLRGWCRSPVVADRIASDRPTPSPPPVAPQAEPVLDDITRPKLFGALREGVPIPIALRFAGLSPKAHEYWAERAAAGDAECYELLRTVDRISAEFAVRMMRQAVSTESGAKNAQWALRCLWRDFFGEHAPDKAPERSVLDTYTDEELDAIAAADV